MGKKVVTSLPEQVYVFLTPVLNDQHHHFGIHAIISPNIPFANYQSLSVNAEGCAQRA